MKIGFTLDEKILKEIDSSELLAIAKNHSISSIELSPDEALLPLDTYLSLAKDCDDLDIDINFHIPYFAHKYLYDINYFSEFKAKMIKKYEGFFLTLEKIQDITLSKSIVTLHGGEYTFKSDKANSFYNTLLFLDWLLNFIEKKNLSIKLALETLSGECNQSIGSNREDIYKILNEFKSSRLGICWDISHDSTNYYPGKVPLDDELYKYIIHTHIHGIDLKNSISHIPLLKSDINFEDEINFLNRRNFEGTLNLELLLKYIDTNYLEDLFNDIKYLNSFIQKDKD